MNTTTIFRDDDTLTARRLIFVAVDTPYDWTVYYANASLTQQIETVEIEQVSQWGMKLPEQFAKLLFPNIKGRYRE